VRRRSQSGEARFRNCSVRGSRRAGAMLNNIPTPWAVAFAAYVGLITYDLASFCTTDPPSDPGLTGRDFTDLVNVTNPFCHSLRKRRYSNG